MPHKVNSGENILCLAKARIVSNNDLHLAYYLIMADRTEHNFNAQFYKSCFLFSFVFSRGWGGYRMCLSNSVDVSGRKNIRNNAKKSVR